MNKELLRAELERDEGLRLKPYKDTVGKLTIGVGRNLDDRGISKATAFQMLDEDIESHWEELCRQLPWVGQLDDARQRVLCNMAFNLGVPTLLTFKQTLGAVQRKDYAAAAVLMLQSKWAKQVGPRADRLARMMEHGA